MNMASKVILLAGTSFSAGYYTWNNLFSVHRVKGQSMYPVLNPDSARSDWVVLNERLSKKLYRLQRGDVVVFRSMRNPTEYHIKRVVALEGDTVKTLGYKNEYVKIPPGHCWVEGDNNKISEDSNRTGPLPLGLISAQATHVVYPRLEQIKPKFIHDRVSINPDVEGEVLRYLNELPSVLL